MDSSRLDPNHLPTPFSAAEIAAACRPGRTLRYQIERAGQPPVVRVSRYVETDTTGGVQESWEEPLDGRRLTEPTQERSTWLDLQRHASFDAATTARDDETIEIPAGTFDCYRYARTDEKGTWRFWFAMSLPGQPVRFEGRIGDEQIVSATLLENSAAPP